MARVSNCVEEAALWVVRLADPECDAAQKQAFQHWLATDPAHAEAYAALDNTWHTLDQASAAFLQRKRRNGVAAVLVLVLCLGGAFRVGMGFDRPIEASSNAITQVKLADGSHLALNVGSAAVVRIGWWSRQVTLTRGEALFDVAQDYRGFAVRAAGAKLVDRGTRFNVRVQNGQGELAVIEGAVEVTAAGQRQRLGAGQRSAFSASGVEPVRAMHASADAWLTERWVFDAASLADIAAELNRHHGLVVTVSPSLSGIRVSGVFSTQDREGLLNALQTLYPLRVEQQAGHIRIRPRG